MNSNNQRNTQKPESEQQPQQCHDNGAANETIPPSKCFHLPSSTVTLSKELLEFGKSISSGLEQGFTLEEMDALASAHPESAHDKDMPPYMYALATAMLLRAEQRKSGTPTYYYWIRAKTTLEATIFLEEYPSGLDKEKTTNTPPPNENERLFWRYANHTGSKHDIVTYLDQKIPCKCMESLKKQALEEPGFPCCCRKTNCRHKRATEALLKLPELDYCQPATSSSTPQHDCDDQQEDQYVKSPKNVGLLAAAGQPDSQIDQPHHIHVAAEGA